MLLFRSCLSCHKIIRTVRLCKKEEMLEIVRSYIAKGIISLVFIIFSCHNFIEEICVNDLVRTYLAGKLTSYRSTSIWGFQLERATYWYAKYLFTVKPAFSVRKVHSRQINPMAFYLGGVLCNLPGEDIYADANANQGVFRKLVLSGVFFLRFVKLIFRGRTL